MYSPAVVAACRAWLKGAARTSLSTRVDADGHRTLSIADGYVPLLVDYTEEDREAKGLRKLEPGQAPRVPVHDTVIEAAAREPLLFLTGPSGCGKSTSILHLALHLAGAIVGDLRWNLARLERAVARNDAGTVVVERWTGPALPPLHVVVDQPDALTGLLSTRGELGGLILDGALDGLLWIDRAERLGDAGPALLVELEAFARARPGLRVIVTADGERSSAWKIPKGFARRRIIPLFAHQRSAFCDLVRPAFASPLLDAKAADEVTGHAGLLTIALENGVVEPASIAVIDRWLEGLASAHRIAIDALIDRALEPEPDATPAIDAHELARLRQPFVQTRMLAFQLQRREPEEIVALYRHDPLKWSEVLRLVARRRTAAGQSIDPLVQQLMRDEGAFPSHPTIAALRLARDAGMDALAPDLRRALVRALVAIVEQGSLPLALRVEAGCAIAVEGDPRDLDALMEIQGGCFTMGSTIHPNSAPRHRLAVGSYRIGRYPVTNDRYRRFIEETRRGWRSQDGLLPHRANSPAVDLTWVDARAYCEWLTLEWRAQGRIGPSEVVRLPTEPEWERAARGLQEEDGFVYPWPGRWQDDHANTEEAALNDTCTVGLFPAGRSPDGCDDMAGQVWEWTSTSWGEDMTTPRFAYPYADDGREDVAAAPAVRRVLRGACFLSPREKANCVYRGSLEPDGFWRGNGFRIVVAPSAS